MREMWKWKVETEVFCRSKGLMCEIDWKLMLSEYGQEGILHECVEIV